MLNPVLIVWSIAQSQTFLRRVASNSWHNYYLGKVGNTGGIDPQNR